MNRLDYFSNLHACIKGATVTLPHGVRVKSLDDALAKLELVALGAEAKGGAVYFIGNGGSAAIASHMGIDFSKNGRVRALALNDPAALTCLANDYGYHQIFAKQVERHCKPEDVVVIISSSGKSMSALLAAEAARERGCTVVTFSGMDPDNPLRSEGLLNFYIAHDDYGMVELSHLALLHSVVSSLEKRA